MRSHTLGKENVHKKLISRVFREKLDNFSSKLLLHINTGGNTSMTVSKYSRDEEAYFNYEDFSHGKIFHEATNESNLLQCESELE